jgi:hypothetical protein
MHYRLYALSKVSGKITSGTDIDVETDAEAIRAGEAAFPGAPFEIWCKERRVYTSAGMDPV